MRGVASFIVPISLFIYLNCCVWDWERKGRGIMSLPWAYEWVAWDMHEG